MGIGTLWRIFDRHEITPEEIPDRGSHA